MVDRYLPTIDIFAYIQLWYNNRYTNYMLDNIKYGMYVCVYIYILYRHMQIDVYYYIYIFDSCLIHIHRYIYIL
jgi:hypothetical protein